MIWRVFWKYEGNSFAGFVKANTRNGAINAARYHLKRECIITGCVQAHEHQITPQSITLNFANTTDYELFG